jgi:transposase InsO family protein
LDSFYIGKLKGVGKLWQLTACDAACGYGIAQVTRGTPRPAHAIVFLRERVVPAYRRAGHPVRAVLTDRGPKWGPRFTAACTAAQIGHRRTKPGHPWTNSFVEPLQGTILTEHWRVIFRQTYFARADQLERSLQRNLRFYNRERTHRGYRLNGRTPGAVFDARAR